MIITCPRCHKKFNIDNNLIPQDGRLVKCGACNHTWFFKPIESIKKQEYTEIPNIKISEKTDRTFIQVKENKEAINPKTDKLNEKKKFLPAIKKEKSKNFSKLFLVFLISIIGIIILIDTFKAPLSYIIPNINFYLYNLYQSLIDIKLFIINLIN
tara:strand:- start:370 stop:834 length:465 start_codon:yes stop_codon:yes gene_type:complete